MSFVAFVLRVRYNITTCVAEYFPAPWAHRIPGVAPAVLTHRLWDAGSDLRAKPSLDSFDLCGTLHHGDLIGTVGFAVKLDVRRCMAAWDCIGALRAVVCWLLVIFLMGWHR